ncbi:hypothetical protein FGO68_gene17290 [Halteria grandinella]|uniref:Uncharacterized protein n=1 Tax=Halteria grandinella TaxID=5974 RepID=A0A8J8NT39_HALGN|nr:hypothetical protein FGO68_gene17290 [Halteria grandinella]
MQILPNNPENCPIINEKGEECIRLVIKNQRLGEAINQGQALLRLADISITESERKWIPLKSSDSQFGGVLIQTSLAFPVDDKYIVRDQGVTLDVLSSMKSEKKRMLLQKKKMTPLLVDNNPLAAYSSQTIEKGSIENQPINNGRIFGQLGASIMGKSSQQDIISQKIFAHSRNGSSSTFNPHSGNSSLSNAGMAITDADNKQSWNAQWTGALSSSFTGNVQELKIKYSQANNQIGSSLFDNQKLSKSGFQQNYKECLGSPILSHTSGSPILTKQISSLADSNAQRESVQIQGGKFNFSMLQQSYNSSGSSETLNLNNLAQRRPLVTTNPSKFIKKSSELNKQLWRQADAF